MYKLDGTEKTIIIGTVWVSAFLSALALTRNGTESFANSLWFLLFGLAAVGSINKHRKTVQTLKDQAVNDSQK
jgi:hypothetical protein